jgi:hypothetical protein
MNTFYIIYYGVIFVLGVVVVIKFFKNKEQ